MKQALGLSVALLCAFSGAGWATSMDAPLLEAVRSSDHDAIKALLAKHADPNLILPDKSTVLAWAVDRQDPQAVLMLLEKLTPTERAAYVLREAFDYPYREIAEIVQTSEVAARQLVSRARKHLADERKAPVERADQRKLLEAFVAAAQKGQRLFLVNGLDVGPASNGPGFDGRVSGFIYVLNSGTAALMSTSSIAASRRLRGAPGLPLGSSPANRADGPRNSSSERNGPLSWCFTATSATIRLASAATSLPLSVRMPRRNNSVRAGDGLIGSLSASPGSAL